MRNPSWPRLAGISVLVAVTVGSAGCSSARMSDTEADDLFRKQKYGEAADHLKTSLEKQGGPESRDGLLYLLDWGLALHNAGKYDESEKAFQQADKIAEIKDYTSLAAETATLFVSENLQQYKGEEFENVLISTYLAMDYALSGNIDDALVEARRVNQKLYMMITQGKRKYQQSAFARYLSGALYEALGNYNDAYIDYKFVHQLEPKIEGLGKDLWRTAKLSGIREDAEKWDEEYNLSDEDHKDAMKSVAKDKGEIIVLYQNGIAPRKEPNPSFQSVPKFYPRYNPVDYANIQISQVGATGDSQMTNAGTTFELDNIERMAIENLDEKYAGIIAKKIGGLVAKGAVGYGVAKATNSPFLGYLASRALVAADKADLRSWNLLPRDLQVSRVTVAPGTYRLRAAPMGGAVTADKTVQVLAGRKTFVTFRYMP